MLLKANWAISSGAQAQPDKEKVSTSAKSWFFIKVRIRARLGGVQERDRLSLVRRPMSI